MKVIFRFVKARILGASTIITIPREIADESGIKPGDQVLVTYTENQGIKVEKPEARIKVEESKAKAKEDPGS